MDQNIEIIRAKRANIWLAFVCGLSLVVIAFGLFNYLVDKLIVNLNVARVEYQPVIQEIKPTLETSRKTMEKLSDHGVKALDQLSSQIPVVGGGVAKTLESMSGFYPDAKSSLNVEYVNLKKVADKEYADLKHELSGLKTDVQNDIAWLKSEMEEWRRLMTFAIAIFGAIMGFSSIRDILENARWLLSWFSRSEPKS